MTAAILPERPEHASTIEDLLDTAFGPGRFARTAYRLRAGATAIPQLCFVAMVDGEVIGSVRFSPVTIGADPALLLGPLVIHPDHKNRGHGVALMREGLAVAGRLGYRLVMLVGDAPYYARVGFAVVPPGRIRMPGPVDPARLLALELEEGALASVNGLARPARPLAALAEPGRRDRREQERQPDQPGEQRHLADAEKD